MKETVVHWSNGSMGNTVYCLLLLCSEELDNGHELPINDLNFHKLSETLKADNISKVHGSYITLSPSDTNIVCSHTDYLFVQLLRCYKWYEKLPSFDDLVFFEVDHDLTNAEKLEHLILWLHGFPNHPFNFDIYDFFTSDAHDRLSNFIISRGLTPNKRIPEFVRCVQAMNKPYVEEWIWLKGVLHDSIHGNDREIYLQLHQQAFIMTWMMQRGSKFKLMPLVNNTRQFREFLEEQNNG